MDTCRREADELIDEGEARSPSRPCKYYHEPGSNSKLLLYLWGGNFRTVVNTKDAGSLGGFLANLILKA